MDPATAAAGTGPLYLLNSGQEANLYVAGAGELLQLNPGENNRKVEIFCALTVVQLCSFNVVQLFSCPVFIVYSYVMVQL